eukprot:4158465-Pleurochrysis_carterae.AAC.1
MDRIQRILHQISASAYQNSLHWFLRSTGRGRRRKQHKHAMHIMNDSHSLSKLTGFQSRWHLGTACHRAALLGRIRTEALSTDSIKSAGICHPFVRSSGKAQWEHSRAFEASQVCFHGFRSKTSPCAAKAPEQPDEREYGMHTQQAHGVDIDSKTGKNVQCILLLLLIWFRLPTCCTSLLSERWRVARSYDS